jgi:hypothetical protein
MLYLSGRTFNLRTKAVKPICHPSQVFAEPMEQEQLFYIHDFGYGNEHAIPPT